MNEELKVVISAEVAKFKQGVSDAKKVVSDFVKEGTKDFGALNDEFQKVGDKAKGFLKGVGTAVAGAGAAFLALGPATAELRTNQAKLSAAFETAGASAEVATGVYNDLYRVLGDDGQAVEAANHLAKLTTEEKALSEWTTICQGVYATFGDSLPIEGLTEAVNHTAQLGEVQGPLADALEWSGQSTDEFNAKLAECSSLEEREAFIREALNGLYSDAAATYEESAAAILAQNEAQAKMNESMAELGAVAAPIMTMLSELATEVLGQLTPYITEFAEKHGPALKEALSGIGEAVGKVISWIADNWELVSTLAAIVLGIAAALSVFSTVMGIVNAVMMASPVTWIVLAIVAAIAALVAIIVVVIKHWDEIKAVTLKVWNAIVDAVKTAVNKVVEWFNELKSKIKVHIDNIKQNITTIFSNIKEIIVAYIQTAKDIVLTVFDGIKNGIQNRIETVKNVIQNIVKLIKAIFTGDFGAAKEAVLGIFDSIKTGIKNKIENARDTVKSVIDKIRGFFNFTWSLPKLKMPKISITGKFSLSPLQVPKFSISWNKLGGVFDKPTLFNYGGSLQGIGEDGAEAVVPLENNLEWLNKLANMLSDRMGNKPVVLTVDGKVFAQTAISTINQQTRQTGKLALNLV
jgi:phage-related minor tail protein